MTEEDRVQVAAATGQQVIAQRGREPVAKDRQAREARPPRTKAELHRPSRVAKQAVGEKQARDVHEVAVAVAAAAAVLAGPGPWHPGPIELPSRSMAKSIHRNCESSRIPI